MKTLLAAALVLLFALVGCGKVVPPQLPEKPAAGVATPEPARTPKPAHDVSAKPTSSPSAGEYPEGRELFALAETEEAARAIAEEYGIELVEYRYGIAVFHTQEDPYAVVRRGAENGWTPLEVNTFKKPAG
ncbi:MAG: hypothetical protein IKQ69_04105 [Oscillospiraceae bacterium]|nr:hypothetical protein [Oscillospiraceae bacterium]